MKINTANREKLPRFNHYVSKFILENFANNGMLSILDKHTLRAELKKKLSDFSQL
jgi:hypothetical protein